MGFDPSPRPQSKSLLMVLVGISSTNSTPPCRALTSIAYGILVIVLCTVGNFSLNRSECGEGQKSLDLKECMNNDSMGSIFLKSRDKLGVVATAGSSDLKGTPHSTLT